MKTAALPAELSARADEVRTTVARNLSELLDANRWSRRAAAEELGLTHTYVTSRASGAVELSSSDLVMFAQFLDVPVSRFFETPEDGDDNVTTIGRPRGGGGLRRHLYLMDSVGPAGIEPTTSTVEAQQFASTHLAPVASLAERRATRASVTGQAAS